jgi:hypothetical protein
MSASMGLEVEATFGNTAKVPSEQHTCGVADARDGRRLSWSAPDLWAVAVSPETLLLLALFYFEATI